MSSEPATPETAPPVSWPILTHFERRVLGVLVEKAKTTPDIYPLSMNALVTGCNQKSNRDPVLNLTDDQVEDALVSAQAKGLVVRIQGGRVERWRHLLYESWHVEKMEIAVLAELLLRGPQTEGELRARASRMEPIPDLETLRSVLKQLAERRLVVYLGPEGRRGTTVTHGFHEAQELERLRSSQGGHAEEETATMHVPETHASPSPGGSAADIDELRKALADLQGTVVALSEQVQQIKQSLGL
jgi:uncharacterized protein YceH (UPF0502 family)